MADTGGLPQVGVGIHVLVIEEDITTGPMCEMVLESYGYLVTIVKSGEEALELLEYHEDDNVESNNPNEEREVPALPDHTKSTNSNEGKEVPAVAETGPSRKRNFEVGDCSYSVQEKKSRTIGNEDGAGLMAWEVTQDSSTDGQAAQASSSDEQAAQASSSEGMPRMSLQTAQGSSSEGMSGISVQGAQGSSSDGMSLDYLHKGPVDLVLTDSKLPGMSGLDFLKKLKKSSKLKDIQVVLLSLELNDATVNSYMNEGAAECIPRTLQPKSLMELYRHVKRR